MCIWMLWSTGMMRLRDVDRMKVSMPRATGNSSSATTTCTPASRTLNASSGINHRGDAYSLLAPPKSKSWTISTHASLLGWHMHAADAPRDSQSQICSSGRNYPCRQCLCKIEATCASSGLPCSLSVRDQDLLGGASTGQ